MFIMKPGNVFLCYVHYETWKRVRMFIMKPGNVFLCYVHHETWMSTRFQVSL